MLTNECVKPLAGEALTRRLAVVDGTAEAAVTEAGARVDILDQQAAAALATHEQATHESSRS
jgi:hypothetical protein